jgi:hypothetical protein
MSSEDSSHFVQGYYQGALQSFYLPVRRLLRQTLSLEASFVFAVTLSHRTCEIARKEAVKFDCATWSHRAKEMPKECIGVCGGTAPNGEENGAVGDIYFKVYKSQLRVVEKALETAGLMLGTDKSRGYCLEKICADFLADVNVQDGEIQDGVIQKDNAEPSSIKAQRRRLQFTLPSSARTKSVTVPKLRFVKRLADTPSEESELPGRRRTG